MNKKAQLDTDVLLSPMFIILTGVGYLAFAIMIFILKGMDSGDIMPLWVRMATLLLIPLIAYVFSMFE